MAQEHQNPEKPIEKQMGCMSGFLHIFDRNHLVTSKKLNTTKRITSATCNVSGSGSHNVSREPEKAQTSRSTVVVDTKSPAPLAQPKGIQALQVFELKEGAKSSWKFKETHRLSLDSRAGYARKEIREDEVGSSRVVIPRADRVILSDESGCGGIEASGKQKARSSTSVIAKLMGFEPVQENEPQQAKLRRSASESRVTRDLFHHQFIHGGNNKIMDKDESPHVIRQGPSSVSNSGFVDPIGRAKSEAKCSNKGALTSASTPTASSWRLPQHRKSFFEAAEVFPEHHTSSVYGEKDRKLKMRGIDEASNDLETLKQILEAWQLKGLLHSDNQQLSHRNIVYDPNSRSRVINNNFHGLDKSHRNVGFSGERPSSVSPKRERNARSPTRARGSSSPTRSEGNYVRRTNTIVKPKSLTVETSHKVNGLTTPRRGGSPTVNSPSPRAGPKRSGSDPVLTNRPPRNRKNPTAEIRRKEKITNVVITEDESCSESTVSTSSERREMEEYKEGRSLLERCGKLLNSIAEMNGRDQQTSPVSVLDSSFYDSESPSPILKRSIDFRDVPGELLEDDSWNQLTITGGSKIEDNAGSEPHDDLVYISDILRSSHYLPEDSDIFSLLEKQQRFKGKDTSQVSRLRRKLIFDIINEILERDRKLPAFSSWKGCITKRASSLQQIWSEFLKIREREYYGDDLVDVIRGVLTKDLNSSRDTMNGWGERQVELSEVVLDIERMIFRDLVGETIRDFATLASQNTDLTYCRKLVFLS